MGKGNFTNKAVDNSPQQDNDNSGFLLGIISAILLIICISVLLLFNNKQAQKIISEKINLDAFKKALDIESTINDSGNSIDGKKTTMLLTEKTLDVRAEHPNGTVGRLTSISFTKNNTIVEMAVTNGSLHTIYLNQQRKGMIVVDDLGNKYNLQPPLDNPELEINSGKTFKGSLLFQGGVTSQANNLTLITNNQIGSDQVLSRRPKMKFYIAL